MIVFIVFILVNVLWVGRSVMIATMGADWFIELHHGETIPKVDKALKAIQILGLVFIAFVAPVMFLAGTIAAALVYFGALRAAVKEAERDYYIADKELEEEENKAETSSVA